MLRFSYNQMIETNDSAHLSLIYREALENFPIFAENSAQEFLLNFRIIFLKYFSFEFN